MYHWRSSLLALFVLVIVSDSTFAIEPGLPPDMPTGTTITFQGPKGRFVWVLEARDDGLFHWRTGQQRWVKRSNFEPTLTWRSADGSGANDVAGSHASLYPLSAGRTSTIALTSSRGKFYQHTCTVRPVETITVPLGTFPTYPVDCAQALMKTGEVTKRRVYYYSPQHRFFVRRTAGKNHYDVVSITP